MSEPTATQTKHTHVFEATTEQGSEPHLIILRCACGLTKDGLKYWVGPDHFKTTEQLERGRKNRWSKFPL